MTQDERDPMLAAAFAAAERQVPDDAFLTETLERTAQLKRRRVIRRVILGLALSLLAIPLQDVALAVTPMLVHSLVDVPAGWVTDMLAPVNSVGGLLSLLLLVLRAAHRRLFD